MIKTKNIHIKTMIPAPGTNKILKSIKYESDLCMASNSLESKKF